MSTLQWPFLLSLGMRELGYLVLAFALLVVPACGVDAQVRPVEVRVTHDAPETEHADQLDLDAIEHQLVQIRAHLKDVRKDLLTIRGAQVTHTKALGEALGKLDWLESRLAPESVGVAAEGGQQQQANVTPYKRGGR